MVYSIYHLWLHNIKRKFIYWHAKQYGFRIHLLNLQNLKFQISHMAGRWCEGDLEEWHTYFLEIKKKMAVI